MYGWNILQIKSNPQSSSCWIPHPRIWAKELHFSLKSQSIGCLHNFDIYTENHYYGVYLIYSVIILITEIDSQAAFLILPVTKWISELITFSQITLLYVHNNGFEILPKQFENTIFISIPWSRLCYLTETNLKTFRKTIFLVETWSDVAIIISERAYRVTLLIIILFNRRIHVVIL